MLSEDITEEVVIATGDATLESIPTLQKTSQYPHLLRDYNSYEDEEYSPIETLNEDEGIHFHAREWVSSVARDDLMSLTLLLHILL